jgi:hypothetical protein
MITLIGVPHPAAFTVAAVLALGAGLALAQESSPAGNGKKTEYAIVPLAGGDTDIGFGGGALGSVARLDPAIRPYLWRLEGAAFVTFKGADGLTSPYQDVFLLLTANGLLGGRGRLELRPSFTRETNQRYHGLGNASHAEPTDVPARDFFTRTHPAMLARLRIRLRGPLHLAVGTLYTQSFIGYEPESNLARDLASTDPRIRSLLKVDRRHGLHLVEVALLLDTRDDEIAPTTGQWHSLKLRASPWGVGPLPYRYLQLNATARGYIRLGTDRIILAGRAIGDLLMGNVPFYELARYDEASALGGANGVRGIPGDRYHGKRKLFGNLELRATLMDFKVGSSLYALGVAGFFDGGRLWADLEAAPELDGTGPGIKYGTGGGLRLRKGQTFVLRADLAWSPDARPLGFYFLAGHLF